MVAQDDDLIAIDVETEHRLLEIPGPESVERAMGDDSAADDPVTNDSATREDEPAGLSYGPPVTVIPMVHDEACGKVHFYHRQDPLPGWLAIARHPLIRLLAFFVVVGVAVYTVFVLGVMGSFEVMQVVPDRVRQSLDTLSEGLLVMDEHERIVAANQSFCRTAGLSQPALIGKRAGSLDWDCSELATNRDFPLDSRDSRVTPSVGAVDAVPPARRQLSYLFDQRLPHRFVRVHPPRRSGHLSRCDAIRETPGRTRADARDAKNQPG